MHSAPEYSSRHRNWCAWKKSTICFAARPTLWMLQITSSVSPRTMDARCALPAKRNIRRHRHIISPPIQVQQQIRFNNPIKGWGSALLFCSSNRWILMEGAVVMLIVVLFCRYVLLYLFFIWIVSLVCYYCLGLRSWGWTPNKVLLESKNTCWEQQKLRGFSDDFLLVVLR